MGINVSTSMNFNKQQFLKKPAKEVLKKTDADSNEADKILEKFNPVYASNSEFTSYFEHNIFNNLADINLNNSLTETLKYLQAHANEKQKKYILGEIWEQFNQNKNEDNVLHCELIDFEIDNSLENIFAA